MKGADKTYDRNSTGNLKLSKYRQKDGSADELFTKARARQATREIAEIDPKNVRATQDWIDHHNGGQGRPLVRGLKRDPVVAQTSDGKMHVLDGHHRLDRAASEGRKIKANVIKVD
jgi:hypothetical protein